jgi:putative ABC transport system permease protein
MIGALRSTWEMFRAQKLRFLLTVSGVVVGVASLVVMASVLEVGQGVLRAASTSAAGDDILTISNDWQARMNNPDATMLTRGDHAAIAESTLLPPGSKVTATFGMQDRKARFEEVDYTPFTIGIGPDSLEVFQLRVARGRSFSASEFEGTPKILLVGAKALNGEVQPGDVVRVEGQPYVVVGVLEEKPEMGPGGPWSWNQRLIFPEKTYQLNFDPSKRPTNIVVKVAVPPTYEGLVKDYVVATRTVVESILARDRSVKSWQIEGVSQDASTEELVMTTIQALLYLTTLFSMIVGGINIMNILLVTVVERTREIGLRRAVGATQGAILRQFLSESISITVTGAIIGLALAVGLLAVGSWAVTTWVTPWPFRVLGWSVVTSIVFSVGIGVVFGVYPAWRASRLDPVEALRAD